MTVGRLWAFLAVGLPVLAAFLANLSTVDLTYHVRAGESFLDTGQISTSDTFTFTAAGSSWLNQQWGAQVVLAAAYRLGGWTGLVLLRAALVGVTFGLLFEACRRSGLDLRRAAWLTIVAFIVSAVALALRPQLFGMALFALTLLLIADRHRHPGRLLAVPVIVMVWSNIHGSFFLGPLAMALAWLDDVASRTPNHSRTLVLGAAAAGAALVNPFGVEVWRYAFGLSTNAFVTSRISEWQPTSLRTVPGILFFASIAVVVVLLVRRNRLTTWPTLAWLATFAAIGTYAIRGVAWWPLAAAVSVAAVLVATPAWQAGKPASRAVRSSPVHAVLAGLIVVTCVALLPVWRPSDSRLGAPAAVVGDAPPGITMALREIARPGDRILNPQSWGSWFEFALPDNPVAVDSRIEVFPVSVWDRLDQVRAGGSGWEETLRIWNVAVVVVEHDDNDFLDRLDASGWHTAYSDGDGTVLTRPSVASAP